MALCLFLKGALLGIGSPVLSGWKLIDLKFFHKWQGADWAFILICDICFDDFLGNETDFMRM